MTRKYLAPWALFILVCILLLLIASCHPLTGRPVMVIGKDSIGPDTALVLMPQNKDLIPMPLPSAPSYYLIVLERGSKDQDSTYRVPVNHSDYRSAFEGQIIRL